MDERTTLLISLGASTAANCVPCFEHYHKKAVTAGVSSQDILEAVELASRVKNGAHTVIRGFIKNLVGRENACACSDASGKETCCG